MADEKQAATSALDTILTEGKLIRDESQKPFARDLVQEFVNQVVQQGNAVGNHVAPFINQRIQQIDELITAVKSGGNIYLDGAMVSTKLQTPMAIATRRTG